MSILGKVVAIMHLSIAIFYSLYAFIIPSKFIYDYFYFVFLIILQLSWIVFNHECPFSYFYKWYHYPYYKCGYTTTLDDFNELFHSKGQTGENILQIILLFSIIIAGRRSKIANIFVIIFIFIILRISYQMLNNAVGWDTKKIFGKNYKTYKKIYDFYQIKKIHNEINKTIVFIMGVFFIYITYSNKKRIKF